MKYPFNVHADLHVQLNTNRIRVIGNGERIILKFASVREFTGFLLHGRRFLKSVMSVDQFNKLLCSTGMTVCLQYKTLPVAGANASYPFSKLFVWLSKLV